MSELSRFVAVVALCLVLPLAASASDDVAGRRRISLDGTWDFSTDPNRQGEAAQWNLPSVALPTEVPAGYAPKVAGKIQVPGSWDAQGYGVETERVRHNFVGQGWYRRELQIPSDWSSSNSTFLVLSGISRYAKVWIDGVAVGSEAIDGIDVNDLGMKHYAEAYLRKLVYIDEHKEVVPDDIGYLTPSPSPIENGAVYDLGGRCVPSEAKWSKDIRIVGGKKRLVDRK